MEWMDFFVKCESNIIEWFLKTYVLVQHMEQERKMVVAVVEVLKDEKNNDSVKKNWKWFFLSSKQNSNKIMLKNYIPAYGAGA